MSSTKLDPNKNQKNNQIKMKKTKDDEFDQKFFLIHRQKWWSLYNNDIKKPLDSSH